MTEQWRFEMDAEGELARRLGRALQQLGHPQILMSAIGARLQANILLRFETKTDPNGLAWLPLADGTRARYAKRDGGRARGGLLQRTGLMLASLEAHAEADSVEVGFTRPYAIWHEIGTRRMPRRQMLTDDPVTGSLGAGDRQDVLDELEHFLHIALG